MAKKLKRKVLEYPNVKENHYYIYENGDVEIIKTGKKKKVQLSGNGYKYVSLYTGDSNGNSISIAVHRLVALNFIEKTDDDIRHDRWYAHLKDFDRNNTTVNNLVWVSGTELRVLTDMYYDNPKNTKDYAEYICKLLEKDYDPEDICTVLGLSKKKWCPIIAKMYRGQIYKDIVKKYKFR